MFLSVNQSSSEDTVLYVYKRRMGLTKRGGYQNETLSVSSVIVEQTDTFTWSETSDFVQLIIPTSHIQQKKVSSLSFYIHYRSKDCLKETNTFLQQWCLKLIKNDSKGICIVALHCICIVKKIKKSDNKLLRTAMILTLMNSFLYYIILVLFIFLDLVLDIHTTRCSIMHIYRI